MSKKKVLVVGGGGREHALCWKLAQSPHVEEVFCAPGNGGIGLHATCVGIQASDLEGLADFAQREGIHLTVVGPEDPLARGIVGLFRERGLRIFGPSREAAAIEASKVFTKELLAGAGIPTGRFRVFTDPRAALEYIEEVGVPVAVKADGLAAGKGVILAHTLEEARRAVSLIMEERAFGAAGDRVVVEEFLTGEEASFMAITDGATVLPLATSQDHKPVFDGDQGPNTGGMGAYSPAPVVTPALFQEIMETIIRPTVAAMEGAGRPYQGVLYGGLIIEEGRPKVLEYNCRFGDPECQPLMMRLKSDLFELLEAAVEGRLDQVELEWDPRAAVCVVLASKGYPGPYEKGKRIYGLEEAAELEDVVVFHAGTRREGDGFYTNGGRVLGVTALGDTIVEAMERAYQAVGRISFDGMHYRHDIGRKALRHLGARAGSGPKVGIIMGSKSDLGVMKKAAKVLDSLNIPYEMRVASAHRTPRLVEEYCRTARERGIQVIIAGAGMAAHLAGAAAAHTLLPVIGVPIDSSPLKGLDALLSTVQMPPGVPVATVAVGKAGAKNAAWLAARILALSDPELERRLQEARAREEAAQPLHVSP